MKKITREIQIISQFILLSSTLSVIFCDDLFGMRLTTETLKTKENNRYRFKYFVKDEMTGDYKTQEETKDGDSVHGSYTVAEPNGDLRTVTYKAGPKTGFEAKVDVQPSASPMKTTQETTPTTATLTSDVKTSNWATTEKATTIESSVQHFPGGFTLDILKKPQSNQLTQPKTAMGMKFSLNTNFTTESANSEPFTHAATSIKAKTEEKTDSLRETTKSLATTPTEQSEILNAENSTDFRKIDELIEKELDEIEKSMPKLPELLFPDNKTHFKFYKDPEEAILDERITQIARQLAETSLRKEYEERKLGHFIPISVTSIEPSLPSHLSKSYKFTRDDAPLFRPSQSSPIHKLTHVKLIPQYIYKETLLPNYFLPNKRLPAVEKNIPTRGSDKFDMQTYEKITNVPEILKINKSELQVKEINKILKLDGENYSTNYNTSDTETTSVMPTQVPISVKFLPPHMGSTQGSFISNSKTEPQTHNTLVKENLVTTAIPFSNKGTVHPPASTSNQLNITKA